MIVDLLLQVGLRRPGLKPPGCAAGLVRQAAARGGVSGGSSSVCASPAASTGKAARPSGETVRVEVASEPPLIRPEC